MDVQEVPNPTTTTRSTPETPNPYDDLQAISTRMNKLLEKDRYYRWVFEREWFRNVLLYAGQHWIIYDTTTRRWRPKRLPEFFPRTVVNKFAEKANDLVSALVSGDVPLHAEPATGDPEDEATADITDRLHDVLRAEAEIERIETPLASWVAITGNAFLIPYYDPSKEHGVKAVPAMQCAVCQEYVKPTDMPEDGMCPYCAATGVAGSPLIPAVDPATGSPAMVDEPIGAFRSDVCSPFEIRLDPMVRDFTKLREFIRIRTYPIEFAQENWPEFKDQIKADTEYIYGQYYLDALAYVSSSFGSVSGFAGTKGQRVTAYEYYSLPTADYPEGIRSVRLGSSQDLIVEKGPLPYHVGAGPKAGKPFLNIVHFGFDVVPGRIWRKSRMSDLVSLQFFRNIIDSNIQLTVQRTGNSQWLNPKGSGVQNLTGEPGLIVDYNPISLGGTSVVEPKRLPPELSGLAPLVALENKIDDSMERVAGTFFLQGGETPPGVTAASALAYLGERAERSMSPLKREWARSWKHWFEQGLEIFREYATDERVRVIAGKNKKWEVEKFIGSNLKGAVNIIVNYAGLFPKSQATERATIAQLIQLGIINPQDPDQQWEILKVFGETNIKGSTDIDSQEAIKENDRFLEQKADPQVMPYVQNSQVHLKFHADFMKTDEFKDLPPERQAIMFQHIQDTLNDIVTRQRTFAQVTAMLQSSAAGAPTVPGDEPPGNPPAGPGAQGTPKKQQAPGSLPHLIGPAQGEEAAAKEAGPPRSPVPV